MINIFLLKLFVWIEPRVVPLGQFKLPYNDPVDGTISAVNIGVPRIMVVICCVDFVTFDIAENTTKKSSCALGIMALERNDMKSNLSSIRLTPILSLPCWS